MKSFYFFAISLFLISCSNVERDENFKVIAHRGASGYLPEHSLPGIVMAHAWGVDFIEADLVVTADNRLVVLHDHHVDSTTNVAELFPQRKRKDSRYYAVDFTLKELKELSLRERFDPKTGKQVFPQRFGNKKFDFKIPSFEEYIELIQELNRVSHQKVRLYVELKGHSFHKEEGKDILSLFMQVLKKYGLDEGDMLVVQSFHPEPLIRLKEEFKNKLTRVQLIAEDSWHETEVKYYKMKSSNGIKDVAKYAHGIGPWLGQIKQDPEIIKYAKQNKLLIHAYTHRREEIQKLGKTDQEFIDFLRKELKIDGIFSDQADEVLKILGRLNK